ncbi:radical SAM protein [Pseudoruegeria sp. SHC-113]|uniref:radical SAM protein n=1 Tax=Pseudoruegeria sp. SHC-113 TaxID=2855439 RepID=UPI0021BB66B7|nr:radical SAM protein [Pseudoruegeria sp. SHC-113]MCT8160579.1 radical SAM protein [Pseudoruegeria sp. SHC-113]
MKDTLPPAANAGKFLDPYRTAKGEERAHVALSDPQTLWFNTGTLCNIACVNCYIDSSPTNDALVYLTADEVSGYLDQLETRNWGVREIGFTGGEPFMNPEMCEMMARSLARGYEVLVLTNAMRPMMRKSVRADLADLIAQYGDKITFRISLDHWSEAQHDEIRGKGGFAKTLEGMGWLRDQGARLAVAGRMLWQESEAEAREAFAELFKAHGFDISAADPGRTVLFPEMDVNVEVPEITTACWGILNKKPTDVMCASSRMVVKHKGAVTPSVIACTLLPYAPEFDMGATLEEAEKPVQLNHPHCAKFCVLGGASCSA